MAKKLSLAKLGDNILNGVVSNLLVKPGTAFQQDAPLLELETDKSVVEIVAPEGGVLKAWLVKVGDTLAVGQDYSEIEPSAASPKAEPREKAPEPKPAEKEPTPSAKPAPAALKKAMTPAAARKIEVSVPNLGDGIKDALVARVLVAEKDSVKEGQALVEMETDKAAFEVPSTASGVIEKIYVKPQDKLNTGDRLAVILGSTTEAPLATETAARPASSPPAPAAEPVSISAQRVPVAAKKADAVGLSLSPSPYTTIKTGLSVPASPKVRRFAREIGIDITKVTGTGPSGRISEDDVKLFSKNLHQAGLGAGGPSSIGSLDLPDFSSFGETKRLALNGVKKATALQMSKAWQHIPMVTEVEQADITDLENFRKLYKDEVEKKSAKLTLTAILVRALAIVLKEFPNLNSSYDEKAQELVLKDYIHIGIAVDTERGLLVPVIKNADRLNISEIALQMKEITTKAASKKITPEDMRGGTFTLSNLGGIGGAHFTPIINWPEVAILGVSKSSFQPIYDGKQFVPRLIMPLSLTFDHRVIDGAEAARFLVRLKKIVENPFVMTLL